MSEQPDHEVEDVELDQTVAPRPEEEVADAVRSEPDPSPDAGLLT